MKRINAFLLITFVWASFGTFSQEKWQNYSSDKGNYSIQMPAGAQLETSGEESSLTTEKLQIKENELLYVCSVTLHDSDLGETEELAKVSLESFAETVNGQILSQETWKVKKRKGLMATIRLNDDVLIYYRVLIDGNRQFQVVAVTESKAMQGSKNIDKYFKSFKVRN